MPNETILGGAPFNFAYRVNTLGDNGFMVSRLGNDELGKKAFTQIQHLGLDPAFIQWDNHWSTGTVKVSLDENNNPDYVIIPDVAYDYVELTPALLDVVESADCLGFGTLAQRNETSRRTLEKLLEHGAHALKFLDINLRKNCYNLNTVNSSLQAATVLKLNEDEVWQLRKLLKLNFQTLPQFCEIMLEEWALDCCVITLAEKGAFAASNQGKQVYEPGYHINKVDSLGAGDAFSAGFIHKLLRQKSLKAACQFGNILGALIATTPGATTSIPSERIDQMLNQPPERLMAKEFETYLTE